MPSFSNWIFFLYVNIGFIILFMYIVYSASASDIKKNWAQYRCNPAYLPFSEDMQKDFEYCVQNTQINFMGYLLEPITYAASNINNNAGAVISQVNAIRGMFDKIRGFFASIIENVFGVFLNLIIEFEKITISIKDLVGKNIGILVSLMYMMDGSIKTMNSTWNGPPGQMVRSLGKCFHPDTLLELENNLKIPIKFVDVGHTLKAGDKITGILKFSNVINDDVEYEKLYLLKCANGEHIYITGSHMIQYNNKFIEIKNCPLAIPQNDKHTNVVYCLITNTHKIHINEHVFWDYNDYALRHYT